jgi:hypothetical protein
MAGGLLPGRGNWNGCSYGKFGVAAPERLALRYLPEAADEVRSNNGAGSVASIEGRAEEGIEGTRGSKFSGATKFSCGMTVPSSTVSRSSRSPRYLVRLFDRLAVAEASEPERDRTPLLGDGPRLWLESRDPSRLLLRPSIGMRDRIGRSPTLGELELECRPKLNDRGSSSRAESSCTKEGVEVFPWPNIFTRESGLWKPGLLGLFFRSANAFPGFGWPDSGVCWPGEGLLDRLSTSDTLRSFS